MTCCVTEQITSGNEREREEGTESHSEIELETRSIKNQWGKEWESRILHHFKLDFSLSLSEFLPETTTILDFSLSLWKSSYERRSFLSLSSSFLESVSFSLLLLVRFDTTLVISFLDEGIRVHPSFMIYLIPSLLLFQTAPVIQQPLYLLWKGRKDQKQM